MDLTWWCCRPWLTVVVWCDDVAMRRPGSYAVPESGRCGNQPAEQGRSWEERPSARAPASMETGAGRLLEVSLGDAASLGVRGPC
jgi:hypothetical protein